MKAAVALFAERGYDGTSIRAIVSKARVNQAAINYHFKGKEGLYFEVLKVAFEGYLRLDNFDPELLKDMPREEALPLLASLLSLPLGDGYAKLDLTPQQLKEHTEDALVALSLEEAERQPLLEVFEDVHWADPSTLDLLGQLIDQAPTVPLLIVLTYRPEFVPRWPTRSHVMPLTLNRLERPRGRAIGCRLRPRVC